MRPLQITAEQLSSLRALDAKTPPDLPPDQSPPGRSLREFDLDQCEIVGIALDGLISLLEAATLAAPDRSPQQLHITAILGRAVTTRNQLRRAIARLSEAA